MKGMKSPETPARAGYHHGDLRQALLETTLRLVAERGAEGFSLREAAREVGVSPAAAYRHFADKPAVLSALAGEGHGRLAAAMEKAAARADAAAAPPARAAGRFLAIGQAYVEFALRNPSFFRVMFGPACQAEDFEPCRAPSGRDAYEVLSATLDELVESGAVAPDRRPGAEIAAWSAVHGLATLLADGALPVTARQRTAALLVVARSLLRGLGCDEALLPPAPAAWEGPHPAHGKRPVRAAPAPAVKR